MNMNSNRWSALALVVALGCAACDGAKKDDTKSASAAPQASSSVKSGAKASTDAPTPKADPEVEKLVKVLEDPAATARQVVDAADALAKRGEEIVPPLLAAWERQKDDVAGSTTRIGLIRVADGMGKPGLAVLHRALSDSREPVRTSACEAIGKNAKAVVEDEERRKALVALMGPYRDKPECQAALVELAKARKERDGG